MKKWLVVLFLFAGCSFKPTHQELIQGGFREKNITHKGEEFKMYDLSANGWDLQYYIEDNLWIIETGGYAAPHKMTKKKFKAAIDKYKQSLKK